MKFRLPGGVFLGLVILVVVGCATNRPAVEQAPLVVSVAQLKEGQALDYEEFTGRTAAIDSVDMKARATGYLDKVLFKDGDDVKKGQLLYEIDPRTYKAAVKFAKGEVATTQAKMEKSTNDLARARRMTMSNSISRQEYDQYLAERQQAAAQLISNKASLEKSELDLSFCKVIAPISGRISRTKITAGNLVTADVTSLTTIVSQDPIYAYFDVDEQTVLRVQQMIREELSEVGVGKASDYLRQRKLDDATVKRAVDLVNGRLTDANRDRLRQLLEPKLGAKEWRGLRSILEANPKFPDYRQAAVPLYLGTRIEKGYPHAGRLDFRDNRLDSTTGTLRLRGLFSNKERILTPDLSVRIRVPIGEPHGAILVSDAALVTDQDRKFLFVLDDKNEVEQRPVVLGSLYNGMRVIQAGVQVGDWVVVSNLQRVRPGMTVKRKEVSMPTPPGREDLAPLPAVLKK